MILCLNYWINGHTCETSPEFKSHCGGWETINLELNLWNIMLIISKC